MKAFHPILFLHVTMWFGSLFWFWLALFVVMRCLIGQSSNSLLLVGWGDVFTLVHCCLCLFFQPFCVCLGGLCTVSVASGKRAGNPRAGAAGWRPGYHGDPSVRDILRPEPQSEGAAAAQWHRQAPPTHEKCMQMRFCLHWSGPVSSVCFPFFFLFLFLLHFTHTHART